MNVTFTFAEVSALIAFLFSIVGTIIAYLAKSNIEGREKEIDRRIEDVRAVQARDQATSASEFKSLEHRLNVEEKATIRQDGQIALVERTHDDLKSDMNEIKGSMATKSDIASIDRQLAQVHNDLVRALGGRYSQAYPSGQMQAPRPSSDPAKK